MSGPGHGFHWSPCSGGSDAAGFVGALIGLAAIAGLVALIITYMTIILITLGIMVVLGITGTAVLWKVNKNPYSPELHLQAAKVKAEIAQESTPKALPAPEVHHHQHVHLYGVTPAHMAEIVRDSHHQ